MLTTTTAIYRNSSLRRIILPALHHAQRDIERSMQRFNVVNCGRRFGKDVLGQDRAIRQVLKGQPVAWFAPSYRMLADNFRLLHHTLAPVITRKLNNERLEIAGGGFIDFWSLEQPDRARGRKYAHAIINEAAQVSGLLNAWNMVIRPTLADLRGSADMMSTPRGLNGFYTLWTQVPDLPDWSRHSYTTYDNPYIPHDEIESLRQSLPERVYRQEILAEFLEDGAFFQKVREAATILAPDLPANHVGHYIVAGLDWALFNDYTSLTLACRDCNRVVDWDRFNQIDYTYQRIRVIDRLKLWGASVLPERNSIGQPNIELLQMEVQVLPGLDLQPGWNTTATTKPVLIQGISSALEYHGFQIPLEYVDELLSYQVELTSIGHPKYSAPAGQHDDRVISLALAWQAMTRLGVLFA